MKIAITGTIGSGKSVVSDYLRSKGYFVFDCDKYNSYLLSNNKEIINNISESFPECFEHNKINKKKIAVVIFNDENKKQILENILHPSIIQEMNNESKKHELFFAEVPLLFEKNLQDLFDLKILIISSQSNSYERLIMKGYTIEDIKSRELCQLPVEDKLKMSDEIIYNNGSCNDLYSEIDKLLIKYDWK